MTPYISIPTLAPNYPTLSQMDMQTLLLAANPSLPKHTLLSTSFNTQGKFQTLGVQRMLCIYKSH